MKFRYIIISLIFVWSPLSIVFCSEGVLEKRHQALSLSEDKVVSALNGSWEFSRVKHKSAMYHLKERFKKKAQIWESIHGRPLEAMDLLAPYLDEEGYCQPSEEAARLFREGNENFKHVLVAASSWKNIGCFFAGLTTPSADSYPDIPYEWLFGFQVAVEAFYLGADPRGDWLGALSYVRFKKASMPKPPLRNHLFPTNGDFEAFYKEYRDEFAKTSYGSYITPTREVSRLAGMVLDPPQETCASCICRLLSGEAPPEPDLSLPRSSPGDPWNYMHEVRGDYGFHVFMHMFPQLRGESKKLADYGISREVLGDERYTEVVRPFLQPPYELPAGVLVEEGTTILHSGAAAAAASSAVTASAAASSPEASRPAAAAAVEKEVHTSSS